jgi:hypothetical protein
MAIVLLCACAHGELAPAPREPCPECEECEACPAAPPPPVRRKPPVVRRKIIRETCKLEPPPAAPKVSWAPPGCPVRTLGGCLSREDFGATIRYMQAIRHWEDDAFERCAGGQ